MKNILQLIYLLQNSFWDWKALGWMFALFSGFGVKIAFEVSEKTKSGNVIKKTYWVESLCGIFITFVIGYHSRALVINFTDNTDVQAGIFALIGVLGFTLFKILYKIFTNPKLWERIVDSFVNIFLSKYAKKNGVIEEAVKEPTQHEDTGSY